MFALRAVSTVRFLLVALFALIASSVIATPAQAAFDAVTTYNTNNMKVVSFSFQGKKEWVYAGSFQTTLYNADGKAVTPMTNTYCVDVQDYLSHHETVDVGSIKSLAGGNGAYVGSLFAHFAAGATTAVEQAALQLAI